MNQKGTFHQSFLLYLKAMQERYGVTDAGYRRMTFDLDDGKNEKASAVCRRYVEQWEAMKENGTGLLFFGTVGTGKSFLACAIVNGLIDKDVKATVTSFPRLLNILQSARDRQEIIDHLQAYDLLVIDDLGVERDSGYAAEQVYNVIDARYRSEKPLIVTTNLTMDDLEMPQSMQYKRIYDRILEMCPVRLKLTGDSRRAKIMREKQERARSLLLGGENDAD